MSDELQPIECSVIRITSGKKKKKNVFQSTYILHNQVLEVTDASKYLGVKVTEDLTWSNMFLKGYSLEAKTAPKN